MLDKLPLDCVRFNDLPQQVLPGWLVDSIIPEVGISLIVGNTGAMKSFLAQEIISAIINGRKVGNHFETKQGNVLLIDTENHEGLLQFRFIGLGDVPNNFYIVKRDFIDLSNPVVTDDLESLIREINPVVIVIDTLRRTYHGSENDSESINDLFRQLLPLAKDRAILILHHQKKKSKDMSPDDIDLARGSSDIVGVMSSVLSIRKVNNNELIVTQVKNRYGQHAKPFTLQLSEHNGKFSFRHIGIVVEDLTEQATCAGILREWLASHEDGTELKTDYILKKMNEKYGFSESAVKSALPSMLGKVIVKIRKGLYRVAYGDKKLEEFMYKKDTP